MNSCVFYPSAGLPLQSISFVSDPKSQMDVYQRGILDLPLSPSMHIPNISLGMVVGSRQNPLRWSRKALVRVFRYFCELLALLVVVRRLIMFSATLVARYALEYPAPCTVSELLQAVIMMRAYAFTGRRTDILIFLSTGFCCLAAAELWLFGADFVCSSSQHLLLSRER